MKYCSYNVKYLWKKCLKNWGHFVAGRLLLMMFSCKSKQRNIWCGHRMFLKEIRNIFWCLQQMFHAWAIANRETFMSTTMGPCSLPPLPVAPIALIANSFICPLCAKQTLLIISNSSDKIVHKKIMIHREWMNKNCTGYYTPEGIKSSKSKQNYFNLITYCSRCQSKKKFFHQCR